MKKFNFAFLPKDAARVISRLRTKNIPFWIVGGFVRDWLAGLKSSDVDLAAQEKPWPLKKLLHGQLILCRHTIVNYGNVQVTPLRNAPLNLKTRDFTVNAIAIDRDGRIIDPFGGREDAKAHIFRMLSRQSLYEDPIRIVRGCRLAARMGWEIEQKTAQCFLEYSEKENIWNKKKIKLRLGLELRKAFDDIYPSHFLEMARKYNILKYLFPAMQALWNSEPEIASLALSECDAIQPGKWSERMGVLLKYAAFSGKTPYYGTAYNFLREIKWSIVAGEFKKKKHDIECADLIGAMYIGDHFCTDLSVLLEMCARNLPVGTLRGIMEAGNKIFAWQNIQENMQSVKKLLKQIGCDRIYERRIRGNALRILGWNRQQIRDFFDAEK